STVAKDRLKEAQTGEVTTAWPQGRWAQNRLGSGKGVFRTGSVQGRARSGPGVFRAGRVQDRVNSAPGPMLASDSAAASEVSCGFFRPMTRPTTARAKHTASPTVRPGAAWSPAARALKPMSPTVEAIVAHIAPPTASAGR